MYSYVVESIVEARIKPEDAYEWFQYNGARPVALEFRGNAVSIKPGDSFGVRKSANGKEIRLVRPNDINRVITLTLDQAQKLAKSVRRKK